MSARIPKKKLTICDCAILAAVVVLTAVSFIFVLRPSNDAGYAKIVTAETSFTVELDKSDYKFDFESCGYHYTALVDDGSISVVSADCPNKECVSSRSIGKRPGSIVCLPGKMIITCEEVDSVEDADIIVP